MLLFENFNEIHSICNEYNIENYTINKDGSIDVDGNVDLRRMRLTRLPLKFNKVSGTFNCSHNRLTSLEGAPKEVGRSFFCTSNKLTSLEGCPKEIGRHFDCSFNKLPTLKDGPKRVGGGLACIGNKLTSLEGYPKEIGISGFYCENNPIYKIINLFKDYKQFKDLLDDYNYIRGNKIIKVRFEQACIEAGIEMPKEIEGYVII